jgi:hypothetical protein
VVHTDAQMSNVGVARRQGARHGGLPAQNQHHVPLDVLMQSTQAEQMHSYATDIEDSLEPGCDGLATEK